MSYRYYYLKFSNFSKRLIYFNILLEQEADAEEERLRKERERQQKQDVMTLGETREQIATLESELCQLKEEKHQLFLQLKKVLNEDDRRRQLIKETRLAHVIIIIKSKILKNHLEIYVSKFILQCLFGSSHNSRRISNCRSTIGASSIVFTVTTK